MKWIVGSRVRALHATWAGQVVALLPQRRLRVHTDDGLELEVSASELVAEAPAQLPLAPTRSKESHHASSAPRSSGRGERAAAGPPEVLDLHLGELPERYQALAKREGALAAQLAYFDAQLMAALDHRARHGSPQRLVVLHGRGMGTLRAQLQQRLARRPEIAAVEPDVSGRFGIGAALVIRLR